MPNWIRKPRSTGRWDITARLAGVTSGQLILERDGSWVTLTFLDLVVASQGTSYAQWNGVLPPGCRPPDLYRDLPLAQRGTADTAGPIRIDASGQLTIYRHTGVIRGEVGFKTWQPMPTSVPGTEVPT